MHVSQVSDNKTTHPACLLEVENNPSEVHLRNN